MGRLTKQEKKDRVIDAVEFNKARKISADADKFEQIAEIERLKKEKLLGSLISIKDTEEVFLEIGAKTKSQLYRLVSELPPRLEGLPASEMIDIIRSSIDEVCLYLSTSFAVEEPKPSTEDSSGEDEEDEV